VTAEKVKIKAGDETAVFQLTVAKDAPVGRHRGISCKIRLTVEGEPVRFNQAYVDLHVDPPPAPEAVADPQATKGQPS